MKVKKTLGLTADSMVSQNNGCVSNSTCHCLDRELDEDAAGKTLACSPESSASMENWRLFLAAARKRVRKEAGEPARGLYTRGRGYLSGCHVCMCPDCSDKHTAHSSGPSSFPNTDP